MTMESSTNILDLPNEILMKIFSEAKNNKSLMLTYKKFYDLITKLNYDNIKFSIERSTIVRNEKKF